MTFYLKATISTSPITNTTRETCALFVAGT
jgi:hypothetical protein